MPDAGWAFPAPQKAISKALAASRDPLLLIFLFLLLLLLMFGFRPPSPLSARRLRFFLYSNPSPRL